MKVSDLPSFLPRSPLSTHVQGRGENGTHYEILERLGEGAAGVVHACRVAPGNLEPTRTFAMKILLPLQRIVPTDVAYERLRLRFMQEARRSRHLSLPSLPQIFDAGELSGAGFDAHPFYVMERVDGDPLSSLFGAAKPPLGERLAWGTTLARTVGFLHGRGVLHRDIKPANILIDRQARRLFLSDFGVLKWSDVAADYTDGIDTYSSEILTT